MAPPKQICSVYSEIYATYATILKTIADIKAAMSKVIKTKNEIKYGKVSVANSIAGAIVDTAQAEIVSAAYSVAATVASQLLAKASAMVSAAIEAFLGPLFTILMSGPSTLFALVGLPLKEAIKQCELEKKYLYNAKANLDLIISIISKWTIQLSGAKYANKMRQALPYIESAIEKCANLIKALDVSSYNSTITSSYFDQSVYSAMKSDLQSAIEITKSDPIIVNTKKLEARIEAAARVEYTVKIAEINAQYKIDKMNITQKFLSQKRTVESQSEYVFDMYKLEAKRKTDIEVAKTKATARAAKNKDLYVGILNDISDQFQYDMQLLKQALLDFLSNLGKAYVHYRICQSMTYTTYNIRAVINLIISQVIKILNGVGNGAGEAVEGVLRLTKALLESVQELYSDSLRRFSSAEESISSTGLAANLARGNASLIMADTATSATITQTIINAINANELMEEEQNRFNVLVKRIEAIRDWDGKPNVWGSNPADASSPPYGRLIASTTGTIATMITVGLIPNERAVTAIRNRLVETSRLFKSLIRHNSEVSSALNSYAPPTSIYVEKVKDELEKAGPLWLILSAFSMTLALGMIAGNALDSLAGFSDPDDIPSVKNCQKFYSDLFDTSQAEAKIALNSLRRPMQFNNISSAYIEQTDSKREGARKKIEEGKYILPVDPIV